MPPVARVLVVAGFLGAGKTTALAAAAGRLRDRGQRVVCVTNDQASALIDSATLRDAGFAVEEISGGCFCCRFSDLVAAIDQLLARDPDVILCEAVGSCTDVVATVLLPLRRFYGALLDIRPLSVVVDAHDAMAWLDDAAHRAAAGDLQYVYREQLREADVLVLNQCDRVAFTELDAIAGRLQSESGATRVVRTIASRGDGIADWLDAVDSVDAAPRPLLELDYARYAAGEALLGWVDATFDIRRPHELTALVAAVASRLAIALPPDLPPFHLKLRASFGDAHARAQWTRTGDVPSLEGDVADVDASTLVVNARVAMDADVLRDLIVATVGQAPSAVSAFHPAYPVPQIRILDPGAARGGEG
jgi:Ni2+-binding GTPase involved in maturation of urease and hydrogenase